MDQFEAAEVLLKVTEKYLKCQCVVGGCPICKDGGWYPNPEYLKAAAALGMELPQVHPAQATFMGTHKLKPDSPGGPYTVFVDEVDVGAHIIRIEDYDEAGSCRGATEGTLRTMPSLRIP